MTQMRDHHAFRCLQSVIEEPPSNGISKIIYAGSRVCRCAHYCEGAAYITQLASRLQIRFVHHHDRRLCLCLFEQSAVLSSKRRASVQDSENHVRSFQGIVRAPHAFLFHYVDAITQAARRRASQGASS